jgi:hypothetical protein
MIVLHPNTEQYNYLNLFTYGTSELIFVKDGNNRWIVGMEVLNDSNFLEIHDQLNELERIQYIQPPFPI